MIKPDHARGLAVICAALLASGCGGSSDDGTGQLSVGLTDAPVDEADAVVVAFTGIEVKPAEGSAFMLETFDPPLTIDLLDLQDGLNQTIADATVDAGRYNWIRLAVKLDEDGVVDEATESHIVVNGTAYPLWIPSGAQTGLKLVSGFVVPQGGQTALTVDFDLRKSVVLPRNGEMVYFLRPALRLVDNALVGSIAGTVDPNLLVDGSNCVVYVFGGDAVAPDDVDGAEPEPVTTAGVKLDLVEPGQWGYRAAFLPEGPYTLALTCDEDLPDQDDELAFTGPESASVAAGQETELNFAAPAT